MQNLRMSYLSSVLQCFRINRGTSTYCRAVESCCWLKNKPSLTLFKVPEKIFCFFLFQLYFPCSFHPPPPRLFLFHFSALTFATVSFGFAFFIFVLSSTIKDLLRVKAEVCTALSSLEMAYLKMCF